MAWDLEVLRAEIARLFLGLQPTPAAVWADADLFAVRGLRTRARAARRPPRVSFCPQAGVLAAKPAAHGPWIACPDCAARGCAAAEGSVHLCWTCKGSGLVHRRLLALLRAWKK